MATPATEQHLKQVIDNIDKDTRLTGADKIEGRNRAGEQRAALVKDPGLQPTIWDGHCSAALPALDNAPEAHAADPDTRLGNIWAVRPFENSVARQLRCDLDEAQRIVELACKASSARDEDEEDELNDLYERIMLREGSACWLFAGLDSAIDPFSGIDYGALPCRLGLPYRVGEQYVTFAIAPPADTRRPCVLDADWYFQQFWRPGGRTRAFCTASGDGGLEEWIATPPLLLEIGGPISRQTVADGNPTGTMPYDIS